MKKRFTFTLDEDVVKKAKKQAIDENTSLSAKVEKLLSQDSKNNGDEKNTPKKK
ncbi:MAG: hypothetical protein IK062_11030 [Selenomonadaceae bacterium]|nr:hypothetical protein [Selenomonadaceae bacterium]